MKNETCWCGSMAEQLICNQQVDGSTPFTSSNMGDFPSGQRGQTVNLLSLTSVVRIHHPPPTKKELLSTQSSFFVYPSCRLGISSPHNVRCISSKAVHRLCISSRASVHLPAAWCNKGEARHSPKGYTMLRIDDIPQQVADDIHAFGVIGMRNSWHIHGFGI